MPPYVRFYKITLIHYHETGNAGICNLNGGYVQL